jgi:hypothetical protein
VEDLGSANGTLVSTLGRTNLLREGQRMVLSGGARVELGDGWFQVAT